jgi:hypothetical protein
MIEPAGMVQSRPLERGNSSVVEHDLAKVGVAGSNPVSRSSVLRACLPAPVSERIDFEKT